MAEQQHGVSLDPDNFCCSVCMDLLKDPVTLHCGHSYCRRCIDGLWDREEEEGVYRCPQCRESFSPRPVLGRNTMLSEKQLSESRQEVQKRVQERERELKELSQAVEDLKRRSSEVKRLMEVQEKTAVGRAEELLLQLEEEISRLRRRDTELEELSHTDDYIHFIQSFQSLSSPSGSPELPRVVVPPLRYFREVSDSVSELRDRLENILKDTWPTISTTVSSGDVLLPPEPKTREDFLHYCRPLTFDVNSVYKCLSLSENNRKVTFTYNEISYPYHSDRFTDFKQVLCREGFSGRCYWEVEWEGEVLSAAVSYKDIRRTTWESRFGYNDKSWRLEWCQHSYSFMHNNVTTHVPGPFSSRVGVYLDHEKGTLSFYNVSDTMTLIHKVCTTFTRPLYPGIHLLGYRESAELIKLW